MELKHALFSSKAPVVVEGDRKGKELGRQTRICVEVAMGGRVGSSVVVHGGSCQSLALQNGGKDKKKVVEGESTFA